MRQRGGERRADGAFLRADQQIDVRDLVAFTGEGFADVRELKRVISTERREDFYRCFTEKLLTYAIGRGPEPCDIPAVDGIVDRLQREDGRFSAVLFGVIESTPFQRRRADAEKPKVSAN